MPSRHRIVEAVGVRRHFGETAVLRGIDVYAGPGEWVALMGPSGCGKSTLLHVLGGLDVPDAGTVRVAGTAMHPGSAPSRARVRRRHIGFVFQYANLLAHLDARSNVELAGRLGGLSRREARRRATTLLGELGVAEQARCAPATLSGGQQQRVAIARALMNSPDVLLADEPTGSLDSAATDLVLGVLRSLHRNGQTIVMVTHDHGVAAQADRIVRLRDGLIVDNDERHSLMGDLEPDFADAAGDSDPARSSTVTASVLRRLAGVNPEADTEISSW